MLEIKIAIIDLGSNSVRMNILEVHGGEFKLIEQFKEIVRLSEGMGAEKTLKPNAIAKMLDVMREFKRHIVEYEVEKIYPIATAAVRIASNPEAITKPLAELGINLEVVTGEKEAYYDYLGVMNTLDIRDCVIVDTGGASTEIILVRDRIHYGLVSIPFGAVNITEAYLKGKKTSQTEIAAAKKAISDEIDKINWIKSAKNLPIVGLGGSIRALGKTEKLRRDKDDVSMHGFEMSDNDIFALCNKLAKSSLETRKKMDGVGKARADIIIGGSLPLAVLMRKLSSKSLIISTSGLREGVLYEMLKDGKI